MSTLCRSCFDLVAPGDEWVLCASDACTAIRHVNGEVRPRVMDPSREKGLRSRFRRRVRIDVLCPHCKQLDTLRFACPVCKREIPDTRTTDDHLIAVLGAKEAGKTHYLATLYHVLAEAEEPAGDETWEVKLPEKRRKELREELWQPLFEDQRELLATPLKHRFDMDLVLRHRQTERRVLVAFRDLSGEVQTDRQLLPKEEFLLHASGVILLADPLALEGFPKGRWTRPHQEELPPCTEVLRHYRQALETRSKQVRSREEQEERRLLPEHKLLAVAVTKADIALRNRKNHRFWNGADSEPLEPGYWERRRDESDDARDWLLGYTGRELARLASAFGDVSYFFVSSYGYEHKPDTKTLAKPPTPLRVHEPLFALLDRLGGAPDRRDSMAGPRL
jgi:hypothetical protein